MITTTRIADLQKVDYSWITCLRAKDIQDLRSRGVIQLSIFDERDLAEVSDPEHPGERLIVCRNLLMADEQAAGAARGDRGEVASLCRPGGQGPVER